MFTNPPLFPPKNSGIMGDSPETPLCGQRSEFMDQFRNKSGYICDMDGVIYHGNRLLPGAKEFVEWLYREKKKFLFLTNNSGKTPRELQDKLARMGLEVCYHYCIILCYSLLPVLLNLNYMVLPSFIKYIHRFIDCKRKMKITDCV